MTLTWEVILHQSPSLPCGWHVGYSEHRAIINWTPWTVKVHFPMVNTVQNFPLLTCRKHKPAHVKLGYKACISITLWCIFNTCSCTFRYKCVYAQQKDFYTRSILISWRITYLIYYIYYVNFNQERKDVQHLLVPH